MAWSMSTKNPPTATPAVRVAEPVATAAAVHASAVVTKCPPGLFAVLIIAFSAVSLTVARLLRPARPDPVKLMNYECGAEPIGEAWVQFPVGFYLVALVFIVFDALAVFLFPWSLVLRAMGLGAVWTMAAFIGILGLGWLYAYREGVLEWK
jgi:NADH-quinone oxidoreductase subunit A